MRFKNVIAVFLFLISIGLFSVNLEHMCQHPVANVQRDLSGEFGGYNKIFITLGTKP